MKNITSADNSVFKELVSLLNVKGIKKHHKFLLSGEKLIKEFLKSQGSIKVLAEIRTEGHIPLQGLKKTADIHTYILTPPLFKELDEIGTHFNLLLLEVPGVSAHDANQVVEGLELVLPIGDPGNMGAVIRSAVAFNVKKIIITREACHPFHPRAVKASAGAVLKAPLFFGDDLKNYDTENAVALDMNGSSISELRGQTDIRLIVGEEGPGLNFMNAKKVSIPTSGVESLNATVAASIALYAIKNG